MLKSKKRKILSLILAVAIFTVSIIIPSTPVYATVGTDIQISGGMVLSKTVEATSDPDQYKITLGAYSTGEAYTIETEVSRPVDIVLVIDESGSMDWDFTKEQSRWEATQSAINNFVNNVKADAVKNKVNHRIAIVTYAGSSYIYKGTSRYKSSKVNSSDYYNKTGYRSVDGYDNYFYEGLSDNDALFEKVGNEYKKITVSSQHVGGLITGHYEYTYTFSDSTTLVSAYQSTIPDLSPRELYTYRSEILDTAFQDVTVDSQLKNIKATIGDGTKTYPGAIEPGGGTYPADAVGMVDDIFDAYSADYNTAQKRGKLVVYFTDGMPGDGDTFDEDEGNATLAHFKRVKDCGATVYSIGVFEEADCKNPQTLPANAYDKTNKYNNMANRFLFLSSSYYPSASSMTNVGSIASNYETEPFYMSPKDVKSLTDSFTVITDAIHTEYTEVVCTNKARIKDVITPYFVGPESVADITAYYQKCTGIDPNNNKLRTFSDTHEEAKGLDISIVRYSEQSQEDATLVGAMPNDTVIATNFNYKENWCGLDDGTPRGYKVVIEFYITVRDGFLGGNGVPTNQAISGLYDDSGTLLPGFELPMPEPQDIEIKDFSIEVNAATKNVYLHSSLTEKQMDMGATINVYNEQGKVDCTLALDKENYGLSKWRVDHITVDSEIAKAPMTDIVADTTYNIKATVSPKIKEGTVKSSTDTSDDADVLVYVPRITYKDTTITASQSSNYADNFVKLEWVHKNKSGEWKTSDNMVGTAPKLSYEYTPAQGTIYDDTSVKVSKVLMDVNGDGTCETDVTSYCLFEHENCSWTGCNFNSNTSNFVVHTKDAVGNIVIKNTGNTVDANDTFVFTVTSESDKNYKQTVVIKGKGSATIKGVPVGKYTVTQDESWSYKYTCKSTNPQAKTIVGEKPTDTNNIYTFENNKKQDDNIRTAWDYIKNLFKSTGIVSSR